MYPKNAASPEPVAVGAVVQISDGSVQTSGCTVRIKPIGVAEGDGGGTTAYSTDGVVLYTPTQAETNYTSFILIAKKTGCIPACVTVVTTASSTPGTVNVASVNSVSTSSVVAVGAYIGNATAALSVDASGRVDIGKILGTASAGAVGYVGVDWGQVANKTTTNALTGTTIATTQKVDIETIKTNPVVNAGTFTFPANATGASTTNITAGTITTATNLTTNNDKTGYALTSAYDFAKGTTAMTESYSTDGSAPTPAQALLLIQQALTEFVIVGTTMTIKKVDGSTTAATLTLNDGTSPTGVTRAS